MHATRQHSAACGPMRSPHARALRSPAPCAHRPRSPQVTGLQQQLALVNGDNPMLGLQEACELLAEHLAVHLVA